MGFVRVQLRRPLILPNCIERLSQFLVNFAKQAMQFGLLLDCCVLQSEQILRLSPRACVLARTSVSGCEFEPGVVVAWIKPRSP